jgi:GTP-binding protein
MDNPLNAYNTVNKELAMYNRKLTEKPQIVVLNKMDLPDVREAAKKFQTAVKEKQVILISALTGQGIENLNSKIIQLLDRPQ